LKKFYVNFHLKDELQVDFISGRDKLIQSGRADISYTYVAHIAASRAKHNN